MGLSAAPTSRLSMQAFLTASALFILGVATATLESALTNDGSGVSRKYFASYKLPVIDYQNPPEGCEDFDDICPLERKGKVDLAIQAYEDRLSKDRTTNCACGLGVILYGSAWLQPA